MLKGLFTISKIKPLSDSTTAIQITKSDGSTVIGTFDTTSSKMGLGCTPSLKLDVVEDGLQYGSTTFYGISRFYNSGGAGVAIGRDSSDTIGAIAGANQLGFWTYGTSWGERMRIDGSGNVGIACTPSYTFHVEKSVDSQYVSRIINTSSSGLGLQVKAGSSSSNHAFSVIDYSDTYYLFGVRGDGNVGMGCEGDEKLHLYKSSGNCRLKIQTADATSSAGITLYNSTNYVGIYTHTNNQDLRFFTGSSHSDRLIISSTGNLTANGNLKIVSANGQNLIQLREASDTAGSNIRLDLDTGDTCIDRVVNNVATEAFRIARSSGNFTIGIDSNTTPTTKQLAIYGAMVSQTGDFGELYFANAPTTSGSGGCKIAARRYTDNYGTAIDIKCGMSNAEGGGDKNLNTIMTLMGNGNVGIGTTSPDWRLTVAGTAAGSNFAALKLVASDCANTKGVYLSMGKADSTNNNLQLYYYHSSDGSSSNRLGIAAYGGNEIISFMAGGNVGIGCTPSYLTHIKGATPTLCVDNSTASSSGCGTILFTGLDGNSNQRDVVKIIGEQAGNGGYGQLRVQTAFNNTLYDRITVTKEGNVGIGTTSPTPTTSGSLDVHGYTCLGDGAPAIKVKKLTGTTGSSEGSQTGVAHGLTSSKIISISAIVHYNSGCGITPGYPVAGYGFGVSYDGTNVTLSLHDTSSENILSKAFTITIMYEE